jgi:SAM-dependent methyltransferase
MTACNICGENRFGPGPFGRLSEAKLAPRCLNCRSLERHRVARAAIDRFRISDRFATLTLIRFSIDPIVEDRWFATAEVSLYGGENSIDVQKIDREDESYDVVVCSHVIEHVADDTRAVRELVRIVSPKGFLVLAYPRTEHGEPTQDWGRPDPARNEHYRAYGADFEPQLAGISPDVTAIAIKGRDPVTGDGKRFSILSKSKFWTAHILASVPGSERIAMLQPGQEASG